MYTYLLRDYPTLSVHPLLITFFVEHVNKSLPNKPPEFPSQPKPPYTSCHPLRYTYRASLLDGAPPPPTPTPAQQCITTGEGVSHSPRNTATEYLRDLATLGVQNGNWHPDLHHGYKQVRQLHTDAPTTSHQPSTRPAGPRPMWPVAATGSTSSYTSVSPKAGSFEHEANHAIGLLLLYRFLRGWYRGYGDGGGAIVQ